MISTHWGTTTRKPKHNILAVAQRGKTEDIKRLWRVASVPQRYKGIHESKYDRWNRWQCNLWMEYWEKGSYETPAPCMNKSCGHWSYLRAIRVSTRSRGESWRGDVGQMLCIVCIENGYGSIDHRLGWDGFLEMQREKHKQDFEMDTKGEWLLKKYNGGNAFQMAK